jgi:hypothetical protein
LYKKFEDEHRELLTKNERIHSQNKIGATVSTKALFAAIVVVGDDFELPTTNAYKKFFKTAENLETLIYEYREGSVVDEDSILRGLQHYILDARRAGLISKDLNHKILTLANVLTHLTIINEFLHEFLPFMMGIRYVSFGKDGLTSLAKSFDVSNVISDEFRTRKFDLPSPAAE